MNQLPSERKRISPLKDVPPHFPGESLADKLDDLAGEFIGRGMAITFIWVLALLEWYRYYAQARPTPKSFTAIAIIVTAALLPPLRRIWLSAALIRKGLKGERAMGKFLEEELLPQGYRVLHDIPGPEFNVDHVVIGPSGVFSVETKFWEKPPHGHHEITYDNKSVMVDGKTPERDPIVQAKVAGSYIADLIERYTGKRHAVLTFPPKTNPGKMTVWIDNREEVCLGNVTSRNKS